MQQSKNAQFTKNFVSRPQNTYDYDYRAYRQSLIVCQIFQIVACHRGNRLNDYQFKEKVYINYRDTGRSSYFWQRNRINMLPRIKNRLFKRIVSSKKSRKALKRVVCVCVRFDSISFIIPTIHLSKELVISYRIIIWNYCCL